MLDATSNIPSGIRSGNDGDLGAFDQCLRTRSDYDQIEGTIFGKYCLGKTSSKFVRTDNVSYKVSGQRNRKLLTRSINLTDYFAFQGSSALNLWRSLCIPHACEALEVAHVFIGNGTGLKTEFMNVVCQSAHTQPSFTTGDIVAM